MDTPKYPYWIDQDGILWQMVAPNPKNPEGYPRRLGLVIREDAGPDTRSVRLTTQTTGPGRPLNTYTLLRERLQDGRPKASTPTPGDGGSLTAATPGNRLVQVTVVERRGPIVLVEHPNGERYYLVICPTCGADLSKGSQAEDLLTPTGLFFRITHPVRCTECAAALCEQPKPGIVTAKGLPPQRQ